MEFVIYMQKMLNILLYAIMMVVIVVIRMKLVMVSVKITTILQLVETSMEETVLININFRNRRVFSTA